MSHPHATRPHRVARGRRRTGALVLAGLALTAALVSASVLPRTAEASRPLARRVVIVLTTDLDWSRIGPEQTPTLRHLLDTGTLANLAASRRFREGMRISTPSEAALTLSAGTWTWPSSHAEAAFDATESVGGQSAAEAYASAYGRSAGGAAVAYLGQRTAQEVQDRASLGARLGSLGEAFEASGVVACIGNSDWGPASTRNLERPAGVAAADERALVALGTVGPSLLATDQNAPFGIRTDLEAFESAYAAVLAESAAGPGTMLAVLDPGDPFRASRAASEGAAGNAATSARLAQRTLEGVVALAARGLGPNDLLVVISVPTVASGASAQGFGSVLLHGREFSAGIALATSASTRRNGLVTLPDISATAVDAAGLAQPAGFIGAPISAVAVEGSSAERIASLAAANATATTVLTVKYRVLTYTAGVMFLAVIASFVLASWCRHRGASCVLGAWLLEALLLLGASMPLGSWLAFVVNSVPSNAGSAMYAFLEATLFVWLVALAIRALAPATYAMAAVTLATAAVLALDQWLGGPLSFSAFLGYSPIEAARFYGLGNEGAAFMISGGLVGVGLLCDALGGLRGRRLASWGIPVGGALLVATAVLPMAGANLGVAVWGTFAVVISWGLSRGGKLTWRLVLAALVIVAVVVVASVWIDTASSAQTHVAKAVTSAEAGGAGVLVTTLARKAAASASYFQATPWIVVFVAFYMVMFYIAFRPRGVVAVAAKAGPAFMGVLRAILLTGLVAFISEDSGIIMPIVLVALTFVGFAYLVLLTLARSLPSRPEAS